MAIRGRDDYYEKTDLTVGVLNLVAYTVATVPDSPDTGDVIFVTDGDTGNPCLAVYDGSDWLRLSLGTAIADS